MRGLTKLVKITEDVRKFAAQQKIFEEQAAQVGLKQKAREFAEKGSELYIS
jgi:phosphomethylpyrimidine synthase